jgi:hypothetical protein
MKAIASFSCALPLAAAAALLTTLALAESGPRTWSFETDRADAPPAGFAFEKTDGGAPGRWIVRAESDAPSAPNVLAQVDTDDTNGRFPMAIASEPSLADLDLSVGCKAISGKVDQACGLVFRYQDANNYYVTRANALEGNVRFYYVKDGKRRQLTSWSGEVKTGAWHELRAQARGDRFTIFWDGKKVLEQQDATFSAAGRVGVWTKADSVTLFDDLSVAAP